MHDQALGILTETMRQSRTAHALLDRHSAALLAVNETLEAIIKEHHIVSGCRLFGDYPQVLDQVLRSADEGRVIRFTHAPSSLAMEISPVKGVNTEIIALQLIATPLPGEESLRAGAAKLEQQFKRTLEEFPVNVWMCSPQGEMFWVNHTANRFSHNQAVVHDASNTYWISKIHPEDLPHCNRVFVMSMMDGVIRPFRYRVRDNNDLYHWHLSLYTPIKDQHGQTLYWAGAGLNIQQFVDNEERLSRLLETQKTEHDNDKRLLREANALLANAQKLELVSNLAGGVAHDLNNLLFIMGLNAELLFKHLQSSTLREYANSVHVNIKKAARLSSQLMGFSGRKPQSISAIEPRKLLKEINDLLEKAVGAESMFTVHVDDDVDLVLVDKMYLENSLINLAINARDAVAGRGSIVLAIGNEKRLVDGEMRDYVAFRMHDDGAGMSHEVQDRIFEPFFTTKAPNKGTGLGLPMVKNFVESSGGYLDVNSVQNVGTTVTIYLPKSSLLPSEDSAEEPVQITAGNDDSLLIIDDDAGVRDALATALFEIGYKRVTTAYNYEYAVQYLKNGMKVDAIVSDIRMPGKLDTTGFLAKLQELNFDGPVIFATGYAEKVVIEHGLVDGKHPVLFKPFSLHELFSKIREVLDARVKTE